MHSDPIADLITRIRNGARARLESVTVPYSKYKERVAQLLCREGYLTAVQVKSRDLVSQCHLVLTIRYDEMRQPVLNGIRRLSSPGRRTYWQKRNIGKVRNGLGIVILTTSAGLLTDREARARKLGGEPLCDVW